MSTLYQKTLKLLEESELSLNQISEDADLPYDWLVAVRYDRIKNPSVNRIQKLYEFLNGSKLSV
jgi:hypothetical protein